MTPVGYLGIVIPKENFYQGFHISDSYQAEGTKLIGTMMGNPVLRSLSSVITKLDIPDEYQSVVGSLCATIASQAMTAANHAGYKEFAKRMTMLKLEEFQAQARTLEQTMTPERSQADATIGACGSAIREIIKRNYFWIEAELEDNEGGIRTWITPMYVSTPDEAKKAIESLNVVRKIQRRLLARYVPEGQGRTIH